MKEVVCYFLILFLLFTSFIPSLSEQFSQKASASAIHLTRPFDPQSVLLPGQSEEGALKHCGVSLTVFGAGGKEGVCVEEGLSMEYVSCSDIRRLSSVEGGDSSSE